MKYCTNCGAQVKENQSFCTCCGAQIRTVSAPSYSAPNPEPPENTGVKATAAALNVPAASRRGLGAAVTSMVCSAISFLTCCGLAYLPFCISSLLAGGLGLIFGIAALSKRSSGGIKAMAIIGIVLGILTVLCCSIVTILVVCGAITDTFLIS